MGGIFILAVALAIGVAWVAAVGYLFVNQRDATLDALRTDAGMLSTNAGAAFRFGGRTAVEETLGSLSRNPAVRWAFITRGDVVLASFGPAPNGAPTWDAQISPGSDHDFQVSLLGLRQKVEFDGRTQGWLYMEADLGPSNLRFLLMALLTFSFALLIVALALRVFQGRLRSIVTPILALTDLARKVTSSGDMSLRTDVTGYREVSRLGEDFNRMLVALERRSVSVQQELEDRRRIESHVEHLASYDHVTHLPNRHYFRNRLDLAVDKANRASEQMALLLIDLDNFKSVNVDLGHYAGDKLLEEVARRLSALLQSGDVICRIGGDEFAIILENLDIRGQAGQLAGRIITALQAPFMLEGNKTQVTASVGIACAPRDTTDSLTLVRFADAAMYRAKELGKNRWEQFSAEMRPKGRRPLEIKSQIRLGIQQAQFVLHFQPQFELATGRVIGAESLMRWQHPERGLLSPSHFIEVAEESGLIVPLGDLLLNQLCRQIKEWRAEGVPLPRISFNVSGRQFAQSGFMDRVLEILKDTGCPAGALEIELTESTLLMPGTDLVRTLETLNSRGLAIAVDDFGTGFSSITYLKHLPIDKLKVDKRFVDDIAENPNDLAIARAIVALGKSLQLDVVAEGVETLEQGKLLREIGCPSMQGYLMSRPLPAAKFAEFCNAHPELRQAGT
ncbi:MAG: EAL domain-containing protein [Rhodocyclaceae bacterium]|nr:EAL domain-containing protein [Rhodocyclaceae bacterium]